MGVAPVPIRNIPRKKMMYNPMFDVSSLPHPFTLVALLKFAASPQRFETEILAAPIARLSIKFCV